MIKLGFMLKITSMKSVLPKATYAKLSYAAKKIDRLTKAVDTIDKLTTSPETFVIEYARALTMPSKKSELRQLRNYAHNILHLDIERDLERYLNRIPENMMRELTHAQTLRSSVVLNDGDRTAAYDTIREIEGDLRFGRRQASSPTGATTVYIEEFVRNYFNELLTLADMVVDNSRENTDSNDISSYNIYEVSNVRRDILGQLTRTTEYINSLQLSAEETSRIFTRMSLATPKISVYWYEDDGFRVDGEVDGDSSFEWFYLLDSSTLPNYTKIFREIIEDVL